MNLNYCIFRSEPIYNLHDLAQIGSHNKREKKTYKSNPNIKLELTKDNIEIKSLTEKYVKGFYNITKDYRKEHEERMKTEREDRKKTFNQMLNNSKNVVADELLFTATPKFFENMTRDDIRNWANTCMEFVYKDLGYTEDQVLHAIVHMDENTPHLHCVVVPLVRKFDKRTNTERYTISKKQYIKDKVHLSQLQDKYHERLVSKGYDLERGIKGSNRRHLKMKEFKNATRYYENKVEKVNEDLDKSLVELEDKMKDSKEIIFNKDYVKIKKDTFDSMNKVIDKTKKALNFAPEVNKLVNTAKDYTTSHQKLEKENSYMKREIKSLSDRNDKLEKENKSLKEILELIIESLKNFFRKLLRLGNEEANNITTNKVKQGYDDNLFTDMDVKDISVGTTKEEELFKYANMLIYQSIIKQKKEIKMIWI